MTTNTTQTTIEQYFKPTNQTWILLKLKPDKLKYNGANQIQRYTDYILCTENDLTFTYVDLKYYQYDHYDGTCDDCHFCRNVEDIVEHVYREKSKIDAFLEIAPELIVPDTSMNLHFYN